MPETPNKIPNFFIVGAPRCGTTAMTEYLKQHPAIEFASYKEPHFFASDLVGPRFEMFRSQGKKYLALFKHTQTEKCVGEASTGYLFSKTAAKEIGEFNSNAKIIIMLRSPIDDLFSIYKQALYTGSIGYPSFEDAIGLNSDPVDVSKLPTEFQILWQGAGVRFTEQVKRYFDVFGREQVHIIIYDDFRADTAKVYRDTLEFLGVDPDFQIEHQVINAQREARSRIMQKIVNHPFIISMGAKIPGVALPIYRIIKNLNAKKAEPMPMNPQTREQLQKEFLPEVEQLSTLLGRDLTHWCRDGS